MVAVTLKRAIKRFGDTVALDGVSLSIRAGEFFFLLGPSGCGKTTLLRAIAGLGPLDSGDIFFDQKKMNKVAPHKRNTTLVFQNYALWPHMTVFDNVAYGLVERRMAKKEIKRRVAEVLELVRLEQAAERRPASLSGGQQQRVALARALVVNPDVVLLDEPLSNLDAHLRNEMRYELKRIQGATGVTMIYVTHDQKEALSMAHTIAVLKDGRLHQVGTPQDLYQDPADVFVADFVGRTNLVPGTLASTDENGLKIDTVMGTLRGRPSRYAAPVSGDLAQGNEVQEAETETPSKADTKTDTKTESEPETDIETDTEIETETASANGRASSRSVICSIRPEGVRLVQSHRSAQSTPATAEVEKKDGVEQGPSAHEVCVQARLLRRLFMGEIEERFYEVEGVELQSVELAPRGAPPKEGEMYTLAFARSDVVVLPSPGDAS